MKLTLYPKLGTISKRKLLKTKGHFGSRYQYKPRGDLLRRLSKETGLSVYDVYDQLIKEREYLLKITSS